MATIQDFYSELNKTEVRYVHFKSNTDIDVSFDGKGDFDVLVSDDDYERFESILTQFGARKFETIKEKRYPYVCSWLIYDEVSGNLFHIHLHKRLVTGKEYVKDYIIPWHNLLIDTRILDSAWNIYITEPNLELILLAARAVVKSKSYDWKNAKRGNYQLHNDLNKERQELQENIDLNKLNYYCELLFPGQDHSSIIDFCRNKEVDSELFLNLSRLIRNNFVKERMMSPLSAEVISRLHSFTYKIKNRLANKFDANIITKKVLENHHGLIVALVGVDGAGKSTTAKNLRYWFGPQIDNKTYFMGEGSGKTGIFVRVIKRVLGIKNQQTTHTAPKTLEESSAAYICKTPLWRKKASKMKSLFLTPKIYTILRALIAVLVQKRNHRLLRKMVRYKRKGGIVITDRYPQMESMGMNDGLKVETYLKKYPSSLILKLFKKLEQSYVGKSVENKPDVVFRLNISAETSMERKPEQKNIDIFQQKIDKLKDITFNNSYIIDIDAERPYNDELLLLKKTIWHLLINDSISNNKSNT